MWPEGREKKKHLPSVLCWGFGTLTGVEWNDLFSIYFDLPEILKWAETLQHLDQITKSRCLAQEFHMRIFPLHCSLSFGIYQFIFPLLFWRTSIEWAENRHGNQQRHTDKDRASIVQSAPTKLWPRHKSRPQAPISHLDGCTRVNSGGKKKKSWDKGWKRDREEGRRQLTVCGRLIMVVIRRDFCWQQDLLPCLLWLSISVTQLLNMLPSWPVNLQL